MAAKKNYVVQLNDGTTTEVEAERAAREEGSRISFYNGEEPVASFINTQGFYVKTAK